MIKTRKELKSWLKYELPLYTSKTRKDKALDIITKTPKYYLRKYVKLLRVTEFYYNNRSNPLYAVMYLIKRRRKNSLWRTWY